MREHAFDERFEGGQRRAHDGDVDLDVGPDGGVDVVVGLVDAVGDGVERFEAQDGGDAAAVGWWWLAGGRIGWGLGGV